MPLVKIHVVEGRYDQARIVKISGAVQAALMNTLRVPPEDFYQLIFELPKDAFGTRRLSSGCSTPTI
jgi:4-oxalocrotonate tautomerase